jgi:two-component system response regulator DctR
MSSQPTIYLCDDDEGVRNSLSFLLKQHGFAVRAFANGLDLLEAIDATPPPLRGVFVLDVRMEPLPGPVVHDRLREKGYAARNPVIFLSGHGDIAAAVAAMAKGALNFVEKPGTDDKLIHQLREALVLEEEWQAKARRREFLHSLWHSLAPQQKRVAILVGEGTLNKVIAGKLNVSDRMVEVHRSKVFEKLGVDSAAELATTLADMRASGIALEVAASDMA